MKINITFDESDLELFSKNPSQHILNVVDEINQRTKKIMAAIDDANAAIARIDAATTAQGVVLASEATTLQTISTEMDALIAQVAAGGVPPALVSAIQAQADKVEAVSATIQKNADFSTAIASKGVTNPVPVPVPTPTPVTPAA